MAGFFSLLRRLYLSLYNWTVLFGWCQVLYFVLKTLNESGHQHVYSAAEKPLHYAQSAAVLEVPDPTSFDFSELWTHPFVCFKEYVSSGNYLKLFLTFLNFWCGVVLNGVLDSSWFGRAGEVSSNSNIATDKFKAVSGLGHLMEFS
ncbi:Very-long-chain (3R)-3-hydroxyacyl-CoA dehydratase PASTICCINO 2 [Glycine max]|nr:Very-long-chain (3R)-3-hydroxyacyl-CoA dehydratase PASTICCINO 2 [Glycine max]